MSCVFCKLVDGTLPSKKVYEDDKILVFHDLQPQTPVHVLAIPKEHIENVNSINEENSNIIGYIFSKIPEIAKDLGLDNGYRIITNCGKGGGQSVFHLHFHIIGGEDLGENIV